MKVIKKSLQYLLIALNLITYSGVELPSYFEDVIDVIEVVVDALPDRIRNVEDEEKKKKEKEE